MGQNFSAFNCPGAATDLDARTQAGGLGNEVIVKSSGGPARCDPKTNVRIANHFSKGCSFDRVQEAQRSGVQTEDN